MQTRGLRITELQELFSQWPNGPVDWLVANRDKLIYASPDAELKLGLRSGQHVAKHPFVRKAVMSRRSLVEHYQTWQDDQLVSTTVVAVPMEIDDVEDGSVLVYGVTNSPSVWKAEEIITLIQEINGQTSSVAALQTFVRGCITLFGCKMAAIWVARSEKYYILAQSTENSQDERCLNDFRVSDVMRDIEENRLASTWDEQSDEFISRPVDRPIAVFNRPGYKHVLSFPLRHLGEELGILELFSQDALSFDGSAMLWLNQLGPLVASLVYGHEMRAVALEREKDLNLLLWGTEILVQIQTEAELLEEAGEMAMVLNLEAGFFFMRQGNNWHVQAPFGRLKQNDKGWEQWVFDQIQLDPDNYTGNKQTDVYVFSPPRPGLKEDFPWRKLLIQPVETNSGIIGELWLLDFVDTKLESRKEVFAAFARSLGVALETIRQRRKLEQMATTDSLTGILNRQGFSQRLWAEIASTQRRGSTFLLLLLDLDGFKILNDTQGHPMGDRALVVISNNIQTFIRENDILARSGGDELSLVLVDMQKGPEAESVINRLKERMGLEEFMLGVSIGVAEFPTEADNYERLYHLADERLYIGKHSGKNKVVFE
ncbi:sensor domain-containing diguanylate cyclase [Desulfosporosinus sp. BICA1-9]|uniref:sensor domain-containing diguanylate cyclase n=1 Tax=Desulfosporosinus sp. BICA1-9 TaxID=1531958 RepID=UPI000AC0E89D|nr:sensor domain-containing diguanylate cyclase [Desulfosporosinus sp. BICA1-9]HBW35711.1 GGDEF domain-containing protein [Desulfosporosinus sp.]